MALTADVTTMDLEKCRVVGMNDYVSKPIDEKILYSKIIGLIKKGGKRKATSPEATIQLKNSSIIDLSYLSNLTKSEPQVMLKMLSFYLQQTPFVIKSMKQGSMNNDWDEVQSASHKLIPSFSIMGITKDYEELAVQIQKNANTKVNTCDIQSLILQLEEGLTQVCIELELEYNLIEKEYSDVH
jgi:HPt (histidine-containing phosphotransfer) domain-containing protein